MRPNEIKARILLKGYSIEAAALAIGEPRPAVSATINYLRLNERVRRKLQRKFGIRFDAPANYKSLKKAA